MCDMKYGHVLNDLQIHTYRIHMCSMSYDADCVTDSYTSHSYMLNEWLKCVTWSIQMYDVTQLCMRNVTHLCRTNSYLQSATQLFFGLDFRHSITQNRMYVCVCVGVYVCVYVCVSYDDLVLLTHTHTHTHTHKRIHTYTSNPTNTHIGSFAHAYILSHVHAN